MALKPITVSQLNDYISRVLMTDPLLGNLDRYRGDLQSEISQQRTSIFFDHRSEQQSHCFFSRHSMCADCIMRLGTVWKSSFMVI